MQTYSIKWNYSSNFAGVFLYKSSHRTKYKWHCTIAFLIHTAPQNVYFILQYHLFSHKEFFFSNVYISLNTIFECSYLSFRSEIDHPLSMCVTREMEWGSSKMCTGVYMGRGVSRLKCTYALTLSLFMFLSYGAFSYL